MRSSALPSLISLLAATWAITALRAEPAAPVDLTLTSPTDYQIVQRKNAQAGQILVAGSLPRAFAKAAELQARIGDVWAGWKSFGAIQANDTVFQGALDLPAGGWYRLEVRAVGEGSVLAAAAVEHVGVGEVFVVAGQSNSANHGEEKQTTISGLVAAFDGANWRLAHDPQPAASGMGGSFIPPFGDALAARFHVPIGVVAMGVGATSVRDWLPHGVQFPSPPTLTGRVLEVQPGQWEAKGKLFENLVGRLRSFGPQGVRAVLWHQGESDANQQDPTRTLAGPLYREYLERIIRDSRREAGWELPCFVAQVSYHTPQEPWSEEIRAAQRSLADAGLALAGPDTDALGAEWREQGGKGVHFSGPGLRQHASLWIERVGPWLQSQLSTPLKPGSERQ